MILTKHVLRSALMFVAGVMWVGAGLPVFAGAPEAELQMLVNRAQQFETAGLMPLARAQYKFILKKYPTQARVFKMLDELQKRETDGWVESAMRLKTQGQLELSLQAVQRALAISPKNGRALAFQASIDKEVAIVKSMRERVAKDYAKGKQHLQNRQWEKALESFVRVLNMDPQHRGALASMERIKRHFETSSGAGRPR